MTDQPTDQPTDQHPHRPRRVRRAVTGVAALTSLGLAVGVGYAVGHGTATPPVAGPPLALANADLTRPTSCEDLLDTFVDRALEQVGPYGWGSGIVAFESAGGADSAASGAETAPGAQRSGVATSRSVAEGSGTNVQEAGVDESDVVKVAGSLLVRLRDGVLQVWDVSGDRPRQLSATPVADAVGHGGPGSPGGELVLVGGRAVVLGTSPDGRGTTVTTVDLADPSSPTVVDVLAVRGTASAVRVHGRVVRVVLDRGLPELDFDYPQGALGQLRARLRNRALVRDTTLADWLPTVDGEPLVDCADVAVPEDDEVPLGSTTVLAFDPADPQARTTSAVAMGSTVSYFSTDRFYLASSPSPWGLWGDCMDCRIGPGGLDGPTHLYAFALDGTDATYVASGSVDGRIADRWSMDAVGGSLRVAVGPAPGTADGNSNTVLTLREDGTRLVEDGRVGGIGPGEEIKSVRWFDDLAVVVTFRQTDPLYAIDLSDPASPLLIGELKVPGYSDYLHPLGARRLVGIGQDATESGQVLGAQAALFDVTDLTAPRQLDVVRWPAGSVARAGEDPRQLTWLPDRRVVLTVVAADWGGQRGWVSELSLDDGTMTDRLVEVEGGRIEDVRLVPLASGRVVMVTAGDVSFLDL